MAVRFADFMWNGACMSGTYPGSIIGPPTSSYTIPLKLADAVGGWDAGPEAIGEDLHMYVKCFFATKGQLIVKPVYAPASHCNISSAMQGVRGYVDCMYARWNQALRHMWGSLDSGYALREGLKLLDEPDWTSNASSSDTVVAPSPPSSSSSSSQVELEELNINTREFLTLKEGFMDEIDSKLRPTQAATSHHASGWRFVLLYARLFEAHFMVLQFSIAVVCSTVYTSLVPTSMVSPLVRDSFWLSGRIRTLSFGIMFLWSLLYERWHELCVHIRESEIVEVDARQQKASNPEAENDSGAGDDTAMSEYQPSLSEPNNSLHSRSSFSRYEKVKYRLQWLVFPVIGALYGTLPSLVVQFRHLFTVELTYVVSAKPAMKARLEEDVT